SRPTTTRSRWQSPRSVRATAMRSRSAKWAAMHERTARAIEPRSVPAGETPVTAYAVTGKGPFGGRGGVLGAVCANCPARRQLLAFGAGIISLGLRALAHGIALVPRDTPIAEV